MTELIFDMGRLSTEAMLKQPQQQKRIARIEAQVDSFPIDGKDSAFEELLEKQAALQKFVFNTVLQTVVSVPDDYLMDPDGDITIDNIKADKFSKIMDGFADASANVTETEKN